jgi:hypothetical protein
MTDRESALGKIAVGDIFHATAPNGAGLICQALRVTDTTIHSRPVTSRDQYEFDRKTGMAQHEINGHLIPCTIDSVALLPADVHEVMLDLGRKNADPSPKEDSGLNDAECRGLVFAAQYYPANPIVPPAQPWQMMNVERRLATGEDSKAYESLTKDEKIDLILINYLIPANRPQD